MKLLTVLNITLILMLIVVVADLMLTIFHPGKTGFEKLVTPIIMLIILWVIRNLHAKRNRALQV